MDRKPQDEPSPPAAPERTAKLTNEDIDRLAAEGLEVGRKLAVRIAPMKVVTADDLKTQMR